MCGRFALGIPKKQPEETFSVEVPEVAARINVAPSQPVRDRCTIRKFKLLC